jgi:hypothetical protein
VHDLRVKVDDILLESQQVLPGNLAADAAADIPVGEKKSAPMRAQPSVMESPMKTAVGAGAFAATRAALSAR